MRAITGRLRAEMSRRPEKKGKPTEFYVNGLHWKIYNDGKNTVYISSVDGLNWSPPTAMSVAPIDDARELKKIDTEEAEA